MSEKKGKRKEQLAGPELIVRTFCRQCWPSIQSFTSSPDKSCVVKGHSLAMPVTALLWPLAPTTEDRTWVEVRPPPKESEFSHPQYLPCAFGEDCKHGVTCMRAHSEPPEAEIAYWNHVRPLNNSRFRKANPTSKPEPAPKPAPTPAPAPPPQASSTLNNGANPASSSSSSSSSKKFQIYECKPCNIQMNSLHQLEQHQSGTKHKAQVEALASGEPVTLSSSSRRNSVDLSPEESEGPLPTTSGSHSNVSTRPPSASLPSSEAPKKTFSSLFSETNNNNNNGVNAPLGTNDSNFINNNNSGLPSNADSMANPNNTQPSTPHLVINPAKISSQPQSNRETVSSDDSKRASLDDDSAFPSLQTSIHQTPSVSSSSHPQHNPLNPTSELIAAIKIGSTEDVARLLQTHPHLTTSNPQAGAYLHLAVTLGHVSVVAELLKTNVWVNVMNDLGQTALHVLLADSKSSPSLQMIQFLAESGCNVNQQDSQGHTGLHYCVLLGHAEALSLLLSHHASPLITSRAGHTPLQLLAALPAPLSPNQEQCKEILSRFAASSSSTSTPKQPQTQHVSRPHTRSSSLTNPPTPLNAESPQQPVPPSSTSPSTGPSDPIIGSSYPSQPLSISRTHASSPLPQFKRNPNGSNPSLHGSHHTLNGSDLDDKALLPMMKMVASFLAALGTDRVMASELVCFREEYLQEALQRGMLRVIPDHNRYYLGLGARSPFALPQHVLHQPVPPSTGPLPLFSSWLNSNNNPPHVTSSSASSSQNNLHQIGVFSNNQYGAPQPSRLNVGAPISNPTPPGFGKSFSSSSAPVAPPNPSFSLEGFSTSLMQGPDYGFSGNFSANTLFPNPGGPLHESQHQNGFNLAPNGSKVPSFPLSSSSSNSNTSLPSAHSDDTSHSFLNFLGAEDPFNMTLPAFPFPRGTSAPVGFGKSSSLDAHLLGNHGKGSFNNSNNNNVAPFFPPLNRAHSNSYDDDLMVQADSFLTSNLVQALGLDDATGDR